MNNLEKRHGSAWNVYLAAPFFNEEQKSVLDIIEAKFGEQGIIVFSPRKECFCPPDASNSDRIKSFNANCEGIIRSDFVLARVDDYDPGTMWEIGYAYCAGTPVVAFTTNETRGLNLMLAQSCYGFVRGIGQVQIFLEQVSMFGDFGLAKNWAKEIV